MAGSLEFIKSATGSNVAFISLTDVFSDKYDVYKCVVSDVGQNSGSGWGDIRFLDSGGGLISDSEYDTAGLALLSYAGFVERRGTNQTSFQTVFHLDSTIDVGTGFVFYIFNPYNSSSYTFYLNQSSGIGYSSGALLIASKEIGVHKSAEQLSGLRILPDENNFTSITASIYGVK